MTEGIEVLKLRKLNSQKNMDNIEKYYDESNRMDVIYDKDSEERDHMSKNDEEKVSDVI